MRKASKNTSKIIKQRFQRALEVMFDQQNKKLKKQRVLECLKMKNKEASHAHEILEWVQQHPYLHHFLQENMSVSIDGQQMNNALLEICRNMSYESFQAREVILRQGEVSNDKLYVILTGSVSVFLDTHLNTPPSDYQKNDDSDSQQQHVSVYSSIQKNNLSPRSPNHNTPLLAVKLSQQDFIDEGGGSSGGGSVINHRPRREVIMREGSQANSQKSFQEYMIQNENDIKLSYGYADALSFFTQNTVVVDTIEDLQTMQERKIQEEERLLQQRQLPIEVQYASLGKKILELGDSEGFGEKALTADIGKQVRAASIVAQEFVECLTLLRADYLFIKSYYSHDTQEKEKTLINIMPSLSKHTHAKQKIYSAFKFELKSKNEKLFDEGANGQTVYFLCEGQCTVSAKITVQEQNKGNNNEEPTAFREVLLFEAQAPSVLGEELTQVKLKPVYSIGNVRVKSEKALFLAVDRESFIGTHGERIIPYSCCADLKSIYEIRQEFLSKHRLRLQALLQQYGSKLVTKKKKKNNTPSQLHSHNEIRKGSVYAIDRVGTRASNQDLHLDREHLLQVQQKSENFNFNVFGRLLQEYQTERIVEQYLDSEFKKACSNLRISSQGVNNNGSLNKLESLQKLRQVEKLARLPLQQLLQCIDVTHLNKISSKRSQHAQDLSQQELIRWYNSSGEALLASNREESQDLATQNIQSPHNIRQIKTTLNLMDDSGNVSDSEDIIRAGEADQKNSYAFRQKKRKNKAADDFQRKIRIQMNMRGLFRNLQLQKKRKNKFQYQKIKGENSFLSLSKLQKSVTKIKQAQKIQLINQDSQTQPTCKNIFDYRFATNQDKNGGLTNSKSEFLLMTQSEQWRHLQSQRKKGLPGLLFKHSLPEINPENGHQQPTEMSTSIKLSPKKSDQGQSFFSNQNSLSSQRLLRAPLKNAKIQILLNTTSIEENSRLGNSTRNDQQLYSSVDKSKNDLHSTLEEAEVSFMRDYYQQQLSTVGISNSVSSTLIGRLPTEGQLNQNEVQLQKNKQKFVGQHSEEQVRQLKNNTKTATSSLQKQFSRSKFEQSCLNKLDLQLSEVGDTLLSSTTHPDQTQKSWSTYLHEKSARREKMHQSQESRGIIRSLFEASKNQSLNGEDQTVQSLSQRLNRNGLFISSKTQEKFF